MNVFWPLHSSSAPQGALSLIVKLSKCARIRIDLQCTVHIFLRFSLSPAPVSTVKPVTQDHLNTMQYCTRFTRITRRRKFTTNQHNYHNRFCRYTERYFSSPRSSYSRVGLVYNFCFEILTWPSTSVTLVTQDHFYSINVIHDHSIPFQLQNFTTITPQNCHFDNCDKNFFTLLAKKQCTDCFVAPHDPPGISHLPSVSIIWHPKCTAPLHSISLHLK